MESITVLLVHYDKESMERLTRFIQELNGYQIIGKCDNGESLVREVISKKPDLVLTVVKLPKKNGIDAMKKIYESVSHTQVIFITEYDEFALEAFEIDAIDYIVKPVDRVRLFKSLEKAKKVILFEKNKQAAPLLDLKFLPLKSRNSTTFIPLNKIIFIEKSGRKCLVYTDEEIFETTEPISDLYHYLDDSFFHGHRSYIVNLTKVSQVTPNKKSYIVQFQDCHHLAKISKLKINELRTKTPI